MVAGGMPDHIHLLVNLRANPSLSKHVQEIKGGSSRWVNESNPSERFAWQVGYGAFTVSESQVESVMRYILTQEEHHKEMTFKGEFVGLLEHHGIEYDERYLWD